MKKTVTIHYATDTAYFTVKETADELGINTQTVRDYLTKGLLKTYKFKTFTLISKQEVEEWKERQK